MRRLILLAALVAVLATDWFVRAPSPRLLFGPTVGDIQATGAVVWCRVEGLAQVTCELRRVGAEGDVPRITAPTEVVCSHGSCSATFAVRDLAPDTTYSIVLPQVSSRPQRTFRTMPAPATPASVRFGFSADVGGQRIGRDVEQNFACFATLATQRLDAFVGLGDMIYADKAIYTRGRLGNRQIPLMNSLLLGRRDFWRHWRYLHQDPGFASFLREVTYVTCWDDHECFSDFGPGDDWGLLKPAREAVFEWNPVLGVPDEPQRLYRSLRWARHCELFLLDCRSERDRMSALDTRVEPKTMLGNSQRRWFYEALAASDATWKVVVSSVPLSCPTGSPKSGYGGWADSGTQTGYERELIAMLREMQRLGIRRPIFLTADVHHAEVLELVPFADDPGFRVLEVVVGPLNAGLFGRGLDTLDPTLHPRSLFYLDPDPAPKTLEEAKRLWNFGVIDINAKGRLRLEIVTVAGDTVYEIALDPEPPCFAEASGERGASSPK